jgi:hypothetical protein
VATTFGDFLEMAGSSRARDSTDTALSAVGSSEPSFTEFNIVDRSCIDKSIALVSAEMERIKCLITSCSSTHMEKLSKDLSKIRNETDLINSMVAFRACTAA